MVIVDFRIGQICFITVCIILMETKCKFAILITSKLCIFILEKYFSHKLTCITTHERQFGIQKHYISMGFDLPLQCTLTELHTSKRKNCTVCLWPTFRSAYTNSRKKYCIARLVNVVFLFLHLKLLAYSSFT